MKTYFKTYFLLFMIALFFASCQDESVEIINPNEQEAIVPNSSLSNLMLRTSANAVSNDNVLDNSDCFSVELPVTVVVGNITIVIENEEGLDELEELLENFENEVPEFIFPITIISADHSETVIENQEQLESLLENCVEDIDIIECVDFVYPISFSVLNTEFVVIDTITIENNEALYEFLDELEDADINLVALNFPVTLEYASGETITVNSNQELSDAISAVGDDCDDDDYEQCNVDEIKASLKECVWEIYDVSNDFNDLYIDFYEDFTLKITGDNLQEPITGNWTVSQDDNGTYLLLTELSGFQEDLQGQWLITECDDDDLYITRDGVNLELDKDCNEADCVIEEVKDYLQTCVWNAVDISGNEQLVDYDLDFQEDGVLAINATGMDTITGTWSVVSITEGIFLNIEGINGTDIQAINSYWKLFECDSDRLKFTDGDAYMILEQDCNDANPFECYPEDGVELIKCDDNNDGFTQFNIYEAVPSCDNSIAPVAITFHTSFSGAENDTDFLEGATAYTNLTNPQTVYVKVKLVSNSNAFLIYPVELVAENCNQNPFDCFDGTVLTACDDTDGVAGDEVAKFDLTIIIEDASCNAEFNWSFHMSVADAENNTNPISQPSTYLSQNGFVILRIEKPTGEYMLYDVGLQVENCSTNACSEAEVDGFLMTCEWKVSEYNSSGDLNIYELDFNNDQELIVLNTQTNETTVGTWSTSTNNDGAVEVLLDGISAPDIQAISGNWTVVECTGEQLIFHRDNDQMTLVKVCD